MSNNITNKLRKPSKGAPFKEDIGAKMKRCTLTTCDMPVNVPPEYGQYGPAKSVALGMRTEAVFGELTR